MNGEALFDLPQAEPLTAPRPTTTGSGDPRWSPYRPKNPVKCDHCTRRLAETNGQAPHARSARFRRQTATTDERLCYEHANIQRETDGLTTYRAPRT